MSRVYWIAAIAFGLAVLSSPVNDAGGQVQGSAVEPEIYIPPPLFGIFERPNTADETAEPCEKGKDNRNSDLCAQWKAADAAEVSADWAGDTFWLGLVGTVFGCFTLIAAALAAYYAKRAAEETKRGADAAHDAIVVTRELGQVQVRAYVAIGNIRVIGFNPDMTPEISYKIKNVGQSPAMRFQNVSRFAIAEKPDEAKLNFAGGEKWDGPSVDLLPGAESAQITKLPHLTKEIYESAMNRDGYLVFYGIAKYRTVFGKRCYVTFSSYLLPDDLVRGEAQLTPTVRHNRSN
jgi:hypothetical protein